MRVSLSPVRKRSGGERIAHPSLLLDATGARVVLGRKAAPLGLVEPIAPAAGVLFGPRGAALGAEGGPLFVSDTGHHRLMIWTDLPTRDGAPADCVIGQPDFASEGRNARGSVGPATLNVPTGVAASDGILAVADAWNHRVLIWRRYPTSSNQPADIVLGQADFAGSARNRGSDAPTAASLNWCYGVAIADGALYVADTGNRRVLKWNRIPEGNGTPADLVLGQRDFATRDENGGRAPDAGGMRWPHGVALDRGRVFVADAGNNRIMAWTTPTFNGAPCAFVLGQSGMGSVDHNQAAYYPTATSLNMPYGLAVLGRRLVTADTANCRLVGYDLDRLDMQAPALWLAGQATFEDKGENHRWGSQLRDSLCWPYGVSASGNTAVVADSGNNRVLIWEAAP